MRYIGLTILLFLVSLHFKKITCRKYKSGCYYKGKFYADKSEIPTKDPCKRCRCDAELREPRCAAMKCSAALCGRTYVPKGTCCPICACKDTRGNHYKEGQKFKSIMKMKGYSMCLECSCRSHGNGHREAICRRPICSKINCISSYTPPGKCCPICKAQEQRRKSCKVGAKHRKPHGSKWQIGDCYTCRCIGGVAKCSKHCPVLTCASPIQKRSECCPKCPKKPRGKFPDHGKGFPFPKSIGGGFPFPKSKGGHGKFPNSKSKGFPRPKGSRKDYSSSNLKRGIHYKRRGHKTHSVYKRRDKYGRYYVYYISDE